MEMQRDRHRPKRTILDGSQILNGGMNRPLIRGPIVIMTISVAGITTSYNDRPAWFHHARSECARKSSSNVHAERCWIAR